MCYTTTGTTILGSRRTHVTVTHGKTAKEALDKMEDLFTKKEVEVWQAAKVKLSVSNFDIQFFGPDNEPTWIVKLFAEEC